MIFDFCPNRHVPETIAPEPRGGKSFNGWSFTSRPAVPYQRQFKLTLNGLHWYLTGTGGYDAATNPGFNARRLELFYEEHENWKTFTYTHPHLGETIECRFANVVNVPKALPNSGGFIEPLEVTLVEHSPAW